MSRIGKAPIQLPKGVDVKIQDNTITVKGPKGELKQTFNPDLDVKVEDGHIIITRPSDDIEHRAQHGLYRALIHNMVVGVSEGYKKEMELVGVGYRATASGQVLELALGFSHAIFIQLPHEIKVEAKTERNKNPLIISNLPTSSSSAKFAPRSARSANPNPTKAKVSNSSVNKSAANPANQHPLNKTTTHDLKDRSQKQNKSTHPRTHLRHSPTSPYDSLPLQQTDLRPAC